MRAEWNKVYLSKWDRITLIKKNIFNLLTYFLWLFPHLASVLLQIEKLQPNFLWSGLRKKFKFHLVGWNNMYSPMRSGGLEICNSRFFNKVFLEECCGDIIMKGKHNGRWWLMLVWAYRGVGALMTLWGHMKWDYENIFNTVGGPFLATLGCARGLVIW